MIKASVIGRVPFGLVIRVVRSNGSAGNFKLSASRSNVGHNAEDAHTAIRLDLLDNVCSGLKVVVGMPQIACFRVAFSDPPVWRARQLPQYCLPN
jgi:hypothetical protein